MRLLLGAYAFWVALAAIGEGRRGALEAALFPVDVVHVGYAVVIGEAGPRAQATVLGFCFVAVVSFVGSCLLVGGKRC